MKFLVRIIFTPWDDFIISKMNEKPGQVYQKCLITYSVAVFFSRSRISPNLRFKLSFIVVFFRMVHKKKLFRRSRVKYRTYSKGPTWSDLFPLCRSKKCRHKLSKNCSIYGKTCSIYVKTCEISSPCNFWTINKKVKINIADVWNWNFWILYGSEIEKERGMARLAPLVTAPLLYTVEIFRNLILRNHWTWTMLWLQKYLNYLTRLELILWYIGLRIEKYSGYFTEFGIILWYIGLELEKHLN